MIFSRKVNCSGTCTWKWGDKRVASYCYLGIELSIMVMIQ